MWSSGLIFFNWLVNIIVLHFCMPAFYRSYLNSKCFPGIWRSIQTVKVWYRVCLFVSLSHDKWKSFCFVSNSQTECQKETVLVSPSMGNHQRLETSLNGLGRCDCASKIPSQIYLLDDKELQCFVLLFISGLSVMVGQVNPIFSCPMGKHPYSNGHIYDQGIYFTGKRMEFAILCGC